MFGTQPIARQNRALPGAQNRWILIINRIHRAFDVAEIRHPRDADEVHAQVGGCIDFREMVYGFAQHFVVRVRVNA